MAEPMYTLCLQYFHNTLTTNFMWLVVIGGKKKVISIVSSNYN